MGFGAFSARPDVELLRIHGPGTHIAIKAFWREIWSIEGGWVGIGTKCTLQIAVYIPDVSFMLNPLELQRLSRQLQLSIAAAS